MPHWLRRQALSRVAAITTMLLMWLAPDAGAQVEPENRTAFLSSVAATTTTTAVVGVIITLVLPNDNVALRRYLRDNAVAVQQDISRGGGPVVDDLADIFGVEQRHKPAFARLLRQQRGVLLELADRDALTDVTTAQFAVMVLADAYRARAQPAEFEPSPEVPEA